MSPTVPSGCFFVLLLESNPIIIIKFIIYSFKLVAISVIVELIVFIIIYLSHCSDSEIKIRQSVFLNTYWVYILERI